MLENARFCALSSTWNQGKDRFMPDEGARKFTPVELIRLAARVDGLSGIELIHPAHVRYDNLDEIKAALAQNGLVAATIAASISSKQHYRAGSLIADDPAVRREAIQTIKTAMDLAAELGAEEANVWLGREGFDYPFQIDYDQAWGRLVDAFREIGAHRPEIKVGIGYKIREPRNWLLVNTAAKTILLAEQTGLDNIGALFDNGHTIWGYENMAEVLSLAARRGRLFHVHFNDNTRYFDDDMLVGSVHLLETLEMLYWLERVGYTGWISFDPHLNIEDEERAVEECMRYTRGMISVLRNIGAQAIERAIATRQVTEIMRLVR
ncbi:MAG: TIM barrel protein, partial [Anaerolineales bacterium]|nr:TIM barrel protein [Anaerolineales bacterium]